MVEKKPRQGQLKPNGKKATPKPLCVKCGEILQRTYVRGTLKTGKRGFVEHGWSCPNKACDYMIKDFVCMDLEEELDDETEPFNELGND